MRHNYWHLLLFLFLGNLCHSQSTNRVPFVTDSLWGVMSSDGRIIVQAKYDRVSPFYDGYSTFELNNKVGVIDSSGDMIVNGAFDQIDIRSNGFFITQKILDNNRKVFGVVHAKHGIILPCEYEKVKLQFPFILYRNSRKWGGCDTTGKFSFSAEYDQVEHLYEIPAIKAKKGSSIIFFDTQCRKIKSEYGELWKLQVVPGDSSHFIGSVMGQDQNSRQSLMEFSPAKGFMELANYSKIEGRYSEFANSGLLKVFEGNHSGLINHDGVEIFLPEYTRIYGHYNSTIFSVKKDGRKTLMDINGTDLLAPDLQLVDKYISVHSGIQVASNGKRKQFVLAIDDNGKVQNSFTIKRGGAHGVFCCPPIAMLIKKRYKVGLLNLEGKRITPLKFKRIRHIGNSIFVTRKKKYYQLYNSQGKLLKTKFPIFNEAGEEILSDPEVHEGFIALMNSDQKWGVIDTNGNVVVPFEYDREPYWKKGVFVVHNESGVGAILEMGEVIVPNKYDDIDVFSSTFFAVLSDGYWSFFRNGKKSLVNHSEIGKVKGGFFLVKSAEGKYGLCNQNGEILLSIEFDQIYTCSDDQFLRLKKSDRWGLYSTADSEIILPMEYTDIEEKRLGVFNVSQGDQSGVWSSEDQFIVPVSYSKIRIVGDLIEVYLNGEVMGYYSFTGKKYY